MDNALFAARVNDAADICEKAQKPKFLGFLTADEAECARRLLNNRRCSTKFFGGYEGAERVMLGCFPDWDEIQDFPVSAVTFTFRKSDALRHRDFLGALMALGIKRETVGDILTEEGRAVIFVTNEVKGFVLSQVEKIGSVGVKVRRRGAFASAAGGRQVRGALPLPPRPTASTALYAATLCGHIAR